jgi:hypothetical protein
MIMKKQYINPTVSVLEIKPVLLQSASNEVNLQSGSASEWGSRRGNSDWDEDDEEDY